MANDNDTDRKATELGSRSPASAEAREQNAAGAQGGPRSARPGETQDQPEQGSQRTTPVQAEQAGTERKSFAPGHAPSEQGDGDPGPEQIAERSSQQGIRGRSGSQG